MRQWVARQGSLDKLASGLTGVEVAGSLPFILSNVPLDGLAAPSGRAPFVDQIGLVLDDPNDFASPRRSFVPEHPAPKPLALPDVERQSNPKLGGSGDRVDMK